MSTTKWFSRSAPSLVLLASLLVACDENDPTRSGSSPLSGLSQAPGKDSTGSPPPPPPAIPTPGYFHGTVLGPSAPGAGNDSVATAPRVAGVVVTVYPRISSSSATPDVGPAAATVVTGADGKFQLPTIAGGEYVVTFNPPAGSPYGGVWVTLPRTIRAESSRGGSCSGRNSLTGAPSVSAPGLPLDGDPIATFGNKLRYDPRSAR